jgi:hypothetical protein
LSDPNHQTVCPVSPGTSHNADKRPQLPSSLCWLRAERKMSYCASGAPGNDCECRSFGDRHAELESNRTRALQFELAVIFDIGGTRLDRAP